MLAANVYAKGPCVRFARAEDALLSRRAAGTAGQNDLLRGTSQSTPFFHDEIDGCGAHRSGGERANTKSEKSMGLQKMRAPLWW